MIWFWPVTLGFLCGVFLSIYVLIALTLLFAAWYFLFSINERRPNRPHSESMGPIAIFILGIIFLVTMWTTAIFSEIDLSLLHTLYNTVTEFLKKYILR